MKQEMQMQIADTIINLLKNFDGSWKKSWREAGFTRAYNLQSKKFYRGLNTLLLWASAQAQGFKSPVWATFDQWKKIKGCSIKKGSVATRIIFWKSTKYNVEVQNTDTGDLELMEKQGMVARMYCVFNSEQVEGYTWENPNPIQENTDLENLDLSFFEKQEVEIQWADGNRPCYVPSIDKILMPKKTSFIGADELIATLSHEFCHSTGVKGRLDRDMSGRFGDESYAMEELIAEIGAGMTATYLGYDYQFRDNNIAYLKSWLDVLKNDNKAIISACSYAQKASDYLIDYYEKQGKETENV